MNTQAASTEVFEPVQYAVTVPLSAERAFRLFTEGFSSWWPGHHIGTAEMAEAVLEPRTGGRYYERGVDGSECEWGQVLACDPPRRIVVAWQITAQADAWAYDPDLSRASEFEVNFREQPDGQTRVELEHRNIGRHGPGAAGIRQGVSGPGGWPGILENYATIANGWVGALSAGFLSGAGMTDVLAGSGNGHTRARFRVIPVDGEQEALVMGGDLTIAVRSERGVVIAAVTGEIDISTVAQLRERLYELADNGGTLIVDLNRVTFIDSAGLGALVSTARRAAEHGGSLHAVCSRPQTRRLLWMTGVDRRIPLAATVDGALMFQARSRDSAG